MSSAADRASMVSSASGDAVEPLTSTADALGASDPTMTRSVVPSVMSSVTSAPEIDAPRVRPDSSNAGS